MNERTSVPQMIWALLLVSGTAPAGFGWGSVASGGEGNPPTETEKERLFRRVFGLAASFDALVHKRVREGEPGKRHYVDRDGDGKAEEVWFIDDAPRHPPSRRPLLVKVIDEDGDLRVGNEPDLDSDLYIADWKADGVVDAVLDYTDQDGDDDVDEMGLYFYSSTGGFLGERALRVWWARDVGDDNLLWYDVGFTYNQTLCQYRTHFGGDELFVSFALSEDGTRWVPFFENPFLFYDHDGDGVTEEVLRVSGIDTTVGSIRHSLDADGDATRSQPRDFDVSISAWAKGSPWIAAGRGLRRGRSSLRFAERFAERAELRAIPTGPFLGWRAAPRFTGSVEWARVMLTWDEIDHNVDGERRADANERWEGVIAHGTDGFPQIGGPSCGPLNRRYELDIEPEGPVRVYYHAADRRLHLRGADRAWMDVDYDLDRSRDMRYEFEDVDGDGILDRWSVDVDGDGILDDSWESPVSGAVSVGWNWPEVHGTVARAVERAPRELWILDRGLMVALEALGDVPADPVWEFLDSQLGGRASDPVMDPATRRKFLSSNETLRFYLGLLRDRLIRRLKKRYGEKSFWIRMDRARAEGDLEEMARVLAKRFPSTAPVVSHSEWVAGCRRRVRSAPVGWARWPGTEDIAWEAERVAYCARRGRFGFYGKEQPIRLFDGEGEVGAPIGKDLAVEALPERGGPGCGGLTLHVNGQAWPLWDPDGQRGLVYRSRLVRSGDEELTVEFEVTGLGTGYSVRVRCSSRAGRRFSRLEVLVAKQDGSQSKDRLEIGVGFQRLPEESLLLDSRAGVFGIWGIPDAEVGRIGMGVSFAPVRFVRLRSLPAEHQAVLKISHGLWTPHNVIGDVLRTRRFNRCPTGADWLGELRRMAEGAGEPRP